MHQKNPEKKFYSVGHRQFCPNMKMVRLEGVKEALETMQPEFARGIYEGMLSYFGMDQ